MNKNSLLIGLVCIVLIVVVGMVYAKQQERANSVPPIVNEYSVDEVIEAPTEDLDPTPPSDAVTIQAPVMEVMTDYPEMGE